MKRLYPIALLILLAACLMPDTAMAQSNVLDSTFVDVDLKEVTITDLLTEVQRQTGLLFAYQPDQVETFPKVTITAGRRSVKEVLDLAFKNTPLQYQKNGNSVVVFVKKNINAEPGTGNQQPGTITGTVKDKQGTPMPGVSIYLKGTNTGTTADAEGNFTIDAKPDDVLVFTFIGYKKIEEVIGARTTINLTMEDEANTLQEIVINGGYYETTDKLKTGSIVKVSEKDIGMQPVTSPLMALQGKVAGLDISPNNGTPGNAPVIRIRGRNSLRISGGTSNGIGLGKGVSDNDDGNYPLYVIDGVPVSAVPMDTYSTFNGLSRGGYDPLSSINPQDIVSIEILKDGDATAIYGSRGANGVILVTTKRKSNDFEKTTMDLSFYAGVGRISNQADLLNTHQYVAMRREAILNDGGVINDFYATDLTRWDTTRYTDWQKVLLGGSANIFDIRTGIQSGSKNTMFRFSGGYHNETLVTPGDFGYHRINGSLSVNHISTDQKLRFNAAANYGKDVSELFSGDFVSDALRLPPNAPSLYDSDGKLNWEIHDFGNGDVRSTWINPISSTLNSSRNVGRNLVSSGEVSYNLYPDIALSVRGGFTDQVSTERKKNPIAALQPQNPNNNQPQYGSAAQLDSKRMSWIVEPSLSISRRIDEHNLSLVLGATWQQMTASKSFLIGTNYTSDALLGSLRSAGAISVNSDDYSDYKYTSAYGRIGYNFRQKYIFNLTGRRDGSSRFGPGNRFANFWSIGSAWIFSNEKFFKNAVSLISFGKLRTSYGVTGTDNIGDYNYYNLYEVKGGLPDQYQGVPIAIPSSLFNPEYAWEVTRKFETALEIGFFEGRINAEVNWYLNRSGNQLVNYTLPATTGFPSVLKNFEAIVQNTGWEVALRADVLDVNDWRWSTALNLTRQNNKLVKFDDIENSPYSTLFKVGEPTSIQFLYTYKGVNPETGLYEVVDKNGDGAFNDFDKSFMNALDKSLYGGLNNTLQYKNIELTFFFQFTKQNIGGRYLDVPGGPANQPIGVLDRWRNSGDITNVQRFGLNTQLAYTRMGSSDFNIVDGSFIRLKTLSIAYVLPREILERSKLQQIKIFIQGQNLLTITNYRGLDPETGNATLPQLRMITAGLQLRI